MDAELSFSSARGHVQNFLIAVLVQLSHANDAQGALLV
jgi:hypothetical protein